MGNHSTHQALRRRRLCREVRGRRPRVARDVGQAVIGLDVWNGRREQRVTQKWVVNALRVVRVPRAILAAEPRVELRALGRRYVIGCPFGRPCRLQRGQVAAVGRCGVDVAVLVQVLLELTGEQRHAIANGRERIVRHVGVCMTSRLRAGLPTPGSGGVVACLVRRRLALGIQTRDGPEQVTCC